MTANDPQRRVRRLVVIDPVGNYGGSARFIRRLLPALLRVRPELRIVFFVNRESIRRNQAGQELEAVGVSVNELESLHPPPWKSRPLRFRLAYKVRRRFPSASFVSPFDMEANLIREVELAMGRGDLTYFPWPYGLSVPRQTGALVTTVHDLNFRYFFGAPIFSLDDTQRFDTRIAEWVTVARVIASSRFMADEIARFHPGAPPARVVRLAPFATADEGEPAEANETLAKFRLDRPYLLCPTHMTVHKNIGPLIAAQALLRDRFPALRLVLTGMGTEVATGRATQTGSARGDGQPDVIGLGYVSNREIDGLIAGASVVVNPSLYEAGNGPGLDAWSRGIPVAMSNIPPFMEHLSASDVGAAVFDPRDPHDIAAKIADILDHADKWAEVARRSKAALGSYTWEHVARAYLEVFDAAFTESDGA